MHVDLQTQHKAKRWAPNWVPEALVKTFNLLVRRVGQESAARHVRNLKNSLYPDVDKTVARWRDTGVIYPAPIGPRLEGGYFFAPIPAVAANMIVKEAFEAAGLHPGLYFSDTKIWPVVHVRHACYHRLHKELFWSLSRIARFSNRDHTSIRNGVLRHAERMKAVEL